jgi:hypothetical protein
VNVAFRHLSTRLRRPQCAILSYIARDLSDARTH